MQSRVVLGGCRPEPLASYLKALGVLRLVGEQKDPDARGAWQGEHFVLESTLEREALVRFFAEEWKPTPVVAPWNGGSGFWPTTSDEAVRSIEASGDERLAEYARTIAAVRAALAALAFKEAPEKGEPKTLLLTYLRARLSDEALAWLDAAAVLTDGDPIYPALLGTGGNDGRQDFSNNFMQRVLVTLSDATGLAPALFRSPSRTDFKGSMGQFAPTQLSRSAPWDFVLALEGALVLAGAATRRLESSDSGTLAFPFHTRATCAPSIVDGEDGHGELWLPLWATPASYRDIRQLFAEGRAKRSPEHSASTGLDFARSVARLGVDRGLAEFVRYSFQPRNGKNYFATPLGRFSTREVPSVRLLDEIDAWYERLRRKAGGKNVPASVAVAKRRLELAMFGAAERGELRPVLLALGDMEQALARSLGFTIKAYLGPAPALGAGWAAAARDGSMEQRLAAALATRPDMHGRLVPLEESGRRFGRSDDPAYVFRPRPLVENLQELLRREDLEVQQDRREPLKGTATARCSLSDLAHFVEGQTDDLLIERWLRAFVLIHGVEVGAPPPVTVLPGALFAVLALVYGRRVGELELPRTPAVLARASAGDALGASELAIRRLKACGRPLPVARLVEPPWRTRRIAAALAFPLTKTQRRELERMVLPAAEDDIHAAVSTFEESA